MENVHWSQEGQERMYPKVESDSEPWYQAASLSQPQQLCSQATQYSKDLEPGMYMCPGVATLAFQFRKGLWRERGASPPTLPTLWHFRDPFLIPLLVLLETSHAHIGILGMDMDGYG